MQKPDTHCKNQLLDGFEKILRILKSVGWFKENEQLSVIFSFMPSFLGKRFFVIEVNKDNIVIFMNSELHS